MGRNKRLRKQLKGYEEQLALHHEKIAREFGALRPDYGRIRHWEAEIKGLMKTIRRLRHKLPGGE